MSAVKFDSRACSFRASGDSKMALLFAVGDTGGRFTSETAALSARILACGGDRDLGLERGHPLA